MARKVFVVSAIGQFNDKELAYWSNQLMQQISDKNWPLWG